MKAYENPTIDLLRLPTVLTYGVSDNEVDPIDPFASQTEDDYDAVASDDAQGED